MEVVVAGSEKTSAYLVSKGRISMNISKKGAFTLIIAILILLNFNACTSKHNNDIVTENNPFEIKVSIAKIINEKQKVFENEKLIETDNIDSRLVLSVQIHNLTDQELKKVWYELKLNNEAKPFIASQIINFKSDKKDVTSKKNALDNQTKPQNNKLLIWGYKHEWGMLLTPEKELKEYHNLTSDQLLDYLKFIEVKVHWKNGEQTKEIPLENVKYE